jgi:hypothetical protein
LYEIQLDQVHNFTATASKPIGIRLRENLSTDPSFEIVSKALNDKK